MPAYTGKEKYIFVSHAREDKDQVLPFIENMQFSGFRVSYHADADEEYSFSIDEKLAKSAVALVFISPNTVDSQNERKDITYILENHKEFLIIYLKDINSQYGLGKQLHDLPSLRQSDYLSEISLLNEILKAQILKDCRNGSLSNFSSEKEKTVQKKLPKQYKIGDTVKFGAYPQNGTGKEAIEWQVLDVKDRNALLISKSVLDCKKYHEKNEDITWEHCTLRKWLNGEFLNTAFSESEKKMIPKVTVSADKNPSYPTNPGNPTQDQAFLLSIAEAKKYFKDDKAQTCKPTKFAVSNGAYHNDVNGNGWWWLRSPGKYPNNEAYIDSLGSIFSYGGSIGSGLISVRPALWINMDTFENNFDDVAATAFSAPVSTAGTPSTNAKTPSSNVNTSQTAPKTPIKNTNKASPAVNPLSGVQKQCKVGDTVQFGAYQQNGTDKESIEWQILDIKNGKALLISKFGLDSKKYHSTRKDITWEDCTLRNWLNEEFLNTAFSPSEKAMIPTVTVPADKNPSYATNPGNPTQDKVFLLSVSEAKQYFPNDNARKCCFTAFAKKNGVSSGSDINCDWLLRSPGFRQNYSANVSPSGYVTDVGNFVSVSSYAVRPVLWVDLKALDPNPISGGEQASVSTQTLIEKKSTQTLIEKKKLQNQCKVGNTIKFGSYPQNGAKKEAIEWQVLDVKGGKALLTSKYALECKPYHTMKKDITWEDCTLRKWLNDEFLNAAFSSSEKAMIPTVTVSADKNPSYKTNPGKATQDKIFLLSIPEAERYFSENKLRSCLPTAFAKGNGVWTNAEGQCFWWLRSPGKTQNYVADVYTIGSIRKEGDYVSSCNSAVRPAMWIDLNA